VGLAGGSRERGVRVGVICGKVGKKHGFPEGDPGARSNRSGGDFHSIREVLSDSKKGPPGRMRSEEDDFPKGTQASEIERGPEEEGRSRGMFRGARVRVYRFRRLRR
jgi:hypothetical protein